MAPGLTDRERESAILARGIPAVVLFPESEEEIPAQVDEYVARMDDSAWARFVTRPFTWARWLTWWAARRWVVPRDIRKE